MLRAPGGRSLPAPVLYPGAVERTSFAERLEAKGYLILELRPADEGGRLLRARFVKLPARPMVVVRLDAPCPGSELRRRLAALDPNAVVQVRRWPERCGSALTAAELRELAPPTMSISLLPGAGPTGLPGARPDPPGRRDRRSAIMG